MSADLPGIRPLNDVGVLRIGAAVRIRQPEHHYGVEYGTVTDNPYAHDDPDHLIDLDGDVRIESTDSNRVCYAKPAALEVLS